MVTVTPKAIGKIREAFQREGVNGGLRLGVLGGGCSGLSYQFKFDVKPRATDQILNFDEQLAISGKLLNTIAGFYDHGTRVMTSFEQAASTKDGGAGGRPITRPNGNASTNSSQASRFHQQKDIFT